MPRAGAAGKGPGRIVPLACMVLFLVITAGTGLVDQLAPAPMPLLTGREKEREEELRRTARFADGSLARLAERHLQLTSRVRSWLIPGYAWFLFEHFQETRGRIVVGRDGWFFIPERATARPESAERQAALGSAIIAAARRRLAGLGIDLDLVPVPRKTVVYREALPGTLDPRPELYPALVEALQRRGIPSVDLLTPFRERRDEILFFHMDTHWNESGQVLAADLLTREFGLQVPEARRRTRLQPTPPADEAGDILRTLGIPSEPGRRPGGMAWPQAPRWRVVPRPGREPFPPARHGTLQPLTIVGTSFTRTRRFADYVAHYADRPVGVMAYEAVPSGEGLARMLEAARAAGRMPERVLWEMPSLELFCAPVPLADCARVFAVAVPPRTSLLSKSGELASWFRADATLHPGRLQVGTTPRVAWLEPGRVFQSSDGVVCVRLAGRPERGALEVAVGSGSWILRTTWPADAQQLVLPVLGAAPGGEAFVRIVGRAPEAALELESLELVSSLDATALVRGSVGGVVAEGGGWHQVVTLPDGTRAAPLAGIVLQLAADADLQAIAVTATDADGAQVYELRLGAPGRHALVLLDAAALAGREIRRLVLRGSGSAPTRCVALGALAHPCR